MASSSRAPSLKQSLTSTDTATVAPIEAEVEEQRQPAEKPVDKYLVAFDGPDDVFNPQNMPRWRKWFITMLGGLLVLNATFASSAPSGIALQLKEYFGLSQEVTVLTIALFVAGYCVGPILWGPLSEQYGRKPIFVVSFTVYIGFQIGCALSKNTASILVFRFLGGTFAAAPLTNSGALIADIWDVKTRGKALAVFTLAPFAGPSLAPVVSGYMDVAGVNWRWVFWLLTIFAGVCLAAIVFLIPETYPPIMLSKKAKKIRKDTGDDNYYAPIERVKVSFTKQLENTLVRPVKMFCIEPMLFAITIYMSFVYGTIYLLFEAYPIVFTQGHGFNQGLTGVMFIPITGGGAIAVTIYVLFWNKRYEQYVADYAPNPVPAEKRLEAAMVAAPLYAVAFFWFGWTSYSSVSFVSPMIAGGLLGLGVSWIFVSLFNYIIDTYLLYAASALAASTIVRSLFGAAFPLFATQMYVKLNPRWASTLLGFIALLLMPIPFAFYRWGHILREKSTFAPTRPTVLPPKESEKTPV